MSEFNIGDALRFQDSTATDTYSSFGQLISNILPNIYIAAGIVVFIMIVAGGFIFISNAGNAEKQKEGGQIITTAIIGLIILFASYWIIQLIQIVTGVPILNSGL